MSPGHRFGRLARAIPMFLALAAAPSLAQGADPADVKRADHLFREGQKQLKAGHLAEACDAFAQSHKLDPAVGSLLNLAECHAQERRFASAHAEFLEAARMARANGQRERETFAKEQAQASEAVLSYVEIKLPPGADDVTVDEKHYARAALPKSMAMDPGGHALTISGKGKITRKMRVEVQNGPVSQTVDVPALDAVKVEAPVQEAPREDPARPRRIAGLATAGAGVLAIGIGAIFGLKASGKKSDAEPHCLGKFCDAEGLSLQDDAHAAATVSTVAFVVGVLAVGAGSYLYFSVPRPAKGIARARIAPTPGGVRFEATW